MKINVSQELLSEIIKDRVKKALNEQKAETKPTMVKIKLSELKEVIKQVIKEDFKASSSINEGKWLGDYNDWRYFDSLKKKINDTLNSGIKEVSFSYLDKDFTIKPSKSGRLLITNNYDFAYEALNLDGALSALQNYIGKSVNGNNDNNLVLGEENEEFKTSFNDNDPQISEAKNFILGEGYTHFAIDKSTGKIATGWEYNGVEKEDIQYYSKLDLNDMFPDRKASEFKIVTRKYLEKSGINPADQNNWLLSSSDQTNMQ